MKVWNKVEDTVAITVKNGYIFYNSLRCLEHSPGLFFTTHGEALDFRESKPTYRNIELFKIDDE